MLKTNIIICNQMQVANTNDSESETRKMYLFICLRRELNAIVLYVGHLFVHTQSIESLLFIGNVLQRDRALNGGWCLLPGASVRVRKINRNRIRVDCGTFKIFY